MKKGNQYHNIAMVSEYQLEQEGHENVNWFCGGNSYKKTTNKYTFISITEELKDDMLTHGLPSYVAKYKFSIKVQIKYIQVKYSEVVYL